MFCGVLKIILLLSLSSVFLCMPTNVPPRVVEPGKTKLVFYYGPEFNDFMVYDLSNATEVLRHPNFSNNVTHCYLHGFHESQDVESIHVIVDAYLKRNDINLLAIDWSMAAGENYLIAAFINIHLLAPALANMTLNLFDAGVDRESFTVVAHSLGAQLAGITGREIIKKSKGATRLSQLVVLDPAYPLFSSNIGLQTVSKADAEFVQAIHTDIGTYGHPIQLGHVDFWPNGGLQGQPGCPQGFIVPFSEDDLCSHQRSWRFWAESVSHASEPRFWAFPSPNYNLFLTEGIEKLKDKTVEMGINCPREARGNYFLRTNSQPMFAMGFGGY